MHSNITWLAQTRTLKLQAQGIHEPCAGQFGLAFSPASDPLAGKGSVALCQQGARAAEPNEPTQSSLGSLIGPHSPL